MKRAGLPGYLLVAFLVSSLVRGNAYAVPAKLLPTVVAAEPAGPRVAVVAIGIDKLARSQQGLIEAAAEEAVARSGRFTLVPLAEAYAPGDAKARAAKEQDAAGRVKEGLKAIDDLDNQKATESATAALKALHDTDFARTFQKYLEALHLKAASYATGGENDKAKEEMDRLIVLDPGYTFSNTLFPPDLLKYAEQQRQKAQGAKGELAVKTRPEGARVWVDGQPKGAAPVTVKGLAPGKHFVTAALGGYALTQEELPLGEQVVELKAADQSPAFVKAEDLVSKDWQGAGRDAALKTLAKRLDVEQVLAFVAKKSTAGAKVDVVGLRLDARDGHNWAYFATTLPMDDPKAWDALAERLLTKDDARKGKDPVTHFKAGGGGGKTVAGIVLVGVGVAAIGAGVFFGVQAQDQAAKYKANPQVQTQLSENYRSQGQTFALVADISYIAGAAAAATGGVLLLTGGGGGDSGGGDADKPKKAPKEPKGDRPPDRLDKRRPDEGKKPADDGWGKKPADEGKKPADSWGSKPAADDAWGKGAADKKKAEEEERARKEAEAKKADEEKAAREAEEKKAEEERAAREEEEKKAEKPGKKKLTKKEREAEERKKREEHEKAKKDEEDKKRREEEEKKRKEEEEKRRAEEEKKRLLEEKRKREKEDDLRNF